METGAREIPRGCFKKYADIFKTRREGQIVTIKKTPNRCGKGDKDLERKQRNYDKPVISSRRSDSYFYVETVIWKLVCIGSQLQVNDRIGRGEA